MNNRSPTSRRIWPRGIRRYEVLGGVDDAGLPYGYIHAAESDESPGLFRVGDQAAVIPSLTGGVALALSVGRLPTPACCGTVAQYLPSGQRGADHAADAGCHRDPSALPEWYFTSVGCRRLLAVAGAMRLADWTRLGILTTGG